MATPISHRETRSINLAGTPFPFFRHGIKLRLRVTPDSALPGVYNVSAETWTGSGEESLGEITIDADGACWPVVHGELVGGRRAIRCTPESTPADAVATILDLRIRECPAWNAEISRRRDAARATREGERVIPAAGQRS